MRMSRCGSGFMLLLCVVALDVPAAEAPRPVATASSSGTMRTAAAAPAKSGYVDDLGVSVSGATLAQLRGGTQVTETMTLSGSVDHNTDNQVVTGFNLIDGNAFGGAAGVPMVIQNSGNNVLIQNATIINVQFQP